MASLLKSYGAKRYRKFKDKGNANVYPIVAASETVYSSQSEPTEVGTNAHNILLTFEADKDSLCGSLCAAPEGNYSF